MTSVEVKDKIFSQVAYPMGDTINDKIENTFFLRVMNRIKSELLLQIAESIFVDDQHLLVQRQVHRAAQRLS